MHSIEWDFRDPSFPSSASDHCMLADQKYTPCFSFSPPLNLQGQHDRSSFFMTFLVTLPLSFFGLFVFRSLCLLSLKLLFLSRFIHTHRVRYSIKERSVFRGQKVATKKKGGRKRSEARLSQSVDQSQSKR